MLGQHWIQHLGTGSEWMQPQQATPLVSIGGSVLRHTIAQWEAHCATTKAADS